jgi:hypothetical protein
MGAPVSDSFIVQSQTIRPKWAGLKVAKQYSGFSIRLLQAYIADDLIRSSLVKKPGCKRGIRLIDLESLDAFIEKGIGAKVELEMNEKRDQSKP